VKRAASVLLAIVIAFAGAVGILLALQSRDDATLERPPAVSSQTTP